MLNIAYTHVSVLLVIFHYYMLQNKQSNSRSNQIKLSISKSKAVTKILSKKLYSDFN